MAPANPESVLDLSLLIAVEQRRVAPQAISDDVLVLFDACAPALLRYVASFGLDANGTEDVVQDVFLALFRHLCLGRSRSNLRGWLFAVAHNLALRERRRLGQRSVEMRADEQTLLAHVDPAPNPEARLAEVEREARLRAVFRALPERDRRCLSLRGDGLHYRDIAKILGISLGAVAKSLTRSLTRLMNADEG